MGKERVLCDYSQARQGEAAGWGWGEGRRKVENGSGTGLLRAPSQGGDDKEP